MILINIISRRKEVLTMEQVKIKSDDKKIEDIIAKLQESEEEIERGEGIEAELAFKELKQQYEY